MFSKTVFTALIFLSAISVNASEFDGLISYICDYEYEVRPFGCEDTSCSVESGKKGEQIVLYKGSTPDVAKAALVNRKNLFMFQGIEFPHFRKMDTDKKQVTMFYNVDCEQEKL